LVGVPAREVNRLLARVHEQGGTAGYSGSRCPTSREYASLVAQFNAERDAEYAEVRERTPTLLAEISTETARGRAIYAEVKESEAHSPRVVALAHLREGTRARHDELLPDGFVW
jgi:uncharacterized protein YdbL (DUF1318 family)